MVISSFRNGLARYNATASRSGVANPKNIKTQYIQTTSYGPFFNGGSSFWDDLVLNGWTRYTYFDSLAVSGTLLTDVDELLHTSSGANISYRDDGFGLGISTFIDFLNTKLQNAGLKTRFYPSTNNYLVGIVNTEENFRIKFYERINYGAGIVNGYGHILQNVWGRVSDALLGDYVNNGSPPFEFNYHRRFPLIDVGGGDGYADKTSYEGD
jgi:hypothetical protein